MGSRGSRGGGSRVEMPGYKPASGWRQRPEAPEERPAAPLAHGHGPGPATRPRVGGWDPACRSPPANAIPLKFMPARKFHVHMQLQLQKERHVQQSSAGRDARAHAKGCMLRMHVLFEFKKFGGFDFKVKWRSDACKTPTAAAVVECCEMSLLPTCPVFILVNCNCASTHGRGTFPIHKSNTLTPTHET